MMAKGPVLSSMIQNGPANLSAYSVEDQDESYWIVLLNKDRQKAVSASVSLPRTVNKAQMWLLTAPSVDSVSGYSLGGSTISLDGSWTPTSTTEAQLPEGKLNVLLPNGSAILVHAQ